MQTPSSPLILAEDGIVCNTQSSPTEFQSENFRPSPSVTKGQNASPTRNKRKTMSLPNVISNSDARTPLAQKSVHRSSRLSIGNEGYCPVMIEKEPSKKCKNWLVHIDEETGEASSVSISILQGWGINCGVEPSDLIEDALMQAPPLEVSDVNDAE
jgi:hypothetical protein